MAKKSPDHGFDFCYNSGKIRHPTANDARSHLKSLKKQKKYKDQESDVYTCRSCGGWHVGRRSQRRKRDIMYREMRRQ